MPERIKNAACWGGLPLLAAALTAGTLTMRFDFEPPGHAGIIEEQKGRLILTLTKGCSGEPLRTPPSPPLPTP